MRPAVTRSAQTTGRDIRPSPLRCRRGTSNGFTLIELLVGVMVGGVLALSIGSVMVLGTQMSVAARGKTRLKQDACHALRCIQRRLRCESQGDIQINAGADLLTYDLSAGSPPYFQQQDDDLVHFDGSQLVTIIEDRVQDVSFALVEGHTTGVYLLQVTLQLVDGNEDLTLQSATRLRNSDD